MKPTTNLFNSEDYEKTKQQRYREVLSKVKVVLCTNSVVPALCKLWGQILSIQMNVLAGILDDAFATADSSCAQGLVLRPKVACFLGDHKQLPPHVGLPAKLLANTMIDRSLIERLVSAGAKRAVLVMQYSMQPPICRISSELFFAGVLPTAEGLERAPGALPYAAGWYDCGGSAGRLREGSSWIN